MPIPAAVFKAKCLKLMDEVARTGRPVVITKRGRPVAQLAPVPTPLRSSFGYMTNTVSIKGDVVASTGERWRADSGEDGQMQATAKPGTRTSGTGSRK